MWELKQASVIWISIDVLSDHKLKLWRFKPAGKSPGFGFLSSCIHTINLSAAAVQLLPFSHAAFNAFNNAYKHFGVIHGC